MIENLISLDEKSFIFVNNLPHPYLLVEISRTLSDIKYGFIWLTITLCLIYIKRQPLGVIIYMIMTLIASSFLAQGILKEVFGRLRPEFLLENITVYGKTADYFSFPSSHAATSFAAAFVLSAMFKKGKTFFYSLALLISLSRVYLGVHYPFDVIFGALLGLAVGFFMTKIINIKPAKHFKTLVLIFILFLISAKVSFAKTIMEVNNNSVTVYEEEQVLGATSDQPEQINSPKTVLNTLGRLINIGVLKDKLKVSFRSGSEGNQDVDEISVTDIKNNIIKIIPADKKLVIKQNLAKAETELPLMVEQQTGKIIADTGAVNKVLNLLPMDVVDKLNNVPVTLELKGNGIKLEYVVKQTKQKKIFGIIPVSANVTTTISAETGEITNKFTPGIVKFLF